MLGVWNRAPAIIELGSGSSSKTRRLITAAFERFGELQYIPIDVSATMLEESARGLVRNFPALQVTGYAVDYRRALVHLATRISRPKCLVFLGSSLGNFDTEEAISLLSYLARAMGPDDRLLLGTDLVKNTQILEAAYNDAQGVTAQFNLNLLQRINRELKADFNLGRFAHSAVYRPDLRRIEMNLLSCGEQVVHIPMIDLQVHFADRESIHTENSHKYSVESLHELAERSGFAEEAAWTDRNNLFRVQRWRLRS
jgi:dimethylhistidine N-methyltransferase